MNRFPPVSWLGPLAVFSALALLLTVGLAEATPLAPDPNNPDLVAEGQGLTIVEAGVGLVGLGVDTRTISINIGGPVEHALLYWAGRQRPCDIVGSTCGIDADPYRDQELTFDGTPIEGVLVGEESQLSTDGDDGQDIHNIGYRADVTSIVAAKGVGLQSFDIADGDTANNLSTLDGAGLVVVYTDPADTEVYRVILFEGLDFAFGRNDQIAEAQVTEPVVFNHGGSDADRLADLVIFAGDATADRPDRIDVTDAFGTTTQFVDQLVAADGPQWDTFAATVNVPANGDTTTVQLFSEPFGENPNSLLWILGALRIPVPQDSPGGEGCTPGYWKQPHHFDSWTGYEPDDRFSDVFGRVITVRAGGRATITDPTLLEALQANGGDVNALARHGVAALLNAASPDVDFGFTEAEVISMVQDAIDNPDTMESVKDDLEEQNEMGCPLN